MRQQLYTVVTESLAQNLARQYCTLPHKYFNNTQIFSLPNSRLIVFLVDKINLRKQKEILSEKVRTTCKSKSPEKL